MCNVYYKLEVITIKEKLKRILAFTLVLTIFTCTMFKKEEKPVQAVAGVDDAALSYLIVTGVCLCLSTFGIATSDSPSSIFTDMFGEEAIDNLKDYFRSVDEAKATGFLVDMNPGIVSSAKRLKAQYKIPVEFNGQFYRYYNEEGIPYASEVLPFAIGTYFIVDNLDMYEYYEPTDSYVLTQEAYSDIMGAVTSLTKKVVNVGKGVVSWLLDKAKANAVDTVAVVSDAYYDKYGDTYRTAMSSVHGDATTLYVDTFNIGISFHGVLLELHTSSGVYFANFKADRFEALNNSYAATGDISVFTNNMATLYSLYNPRGYTPGIGFGLIDNTNGGAISGNDSSTSVTLSMFDGAAAVSTNVGGNASYDAMSSSKVHIINNGNTANYVIGTVAADGTISYDVVGESSTYPYVDGIAHGNNRVKVSGDVVLTDKILQQVMDNNLTVEDISSQVAEVSDSVIAIDDSIKNGFESSNNWLSRIWSFLTGIPGLIVSAFAGLFDSLFNYLSRILSGILDIPGDIVLGLEAIEDVVIDIPGAIAAVATLLPDFPHFSNDLFDILRDIFDFLDFLDDILDLLNALSDLLNIFNILSDLLEVVKSIPGILSGIWETIKSIPGTLSDIWETIKSIPIKIIQLLKDLLLALFVPSETYFNNWNNKFKNMLALKLPYDTYNNFLNDIKEITRYRLDDITVTICGSQVTVLSFKWYYDYEETVNHWIRGVMFLVLVFYNLNMMYKFVRGTSLYKVDKYFGHGEG